MSSGPDQNTSPMTLSEYARQITVSAPTVSRMVKAGLPLVGAGPRGAKLVDPRAADDWRLRQPGTAASPNLRLAGVEGLQALILEALADEKFAEAVLERLGGRGER